MARKPHQVFLEQSIVDLAQHLSKRYTKIGKPICGKRCGSASWFIRNALLERLQKDGVNVGALEDLTNCDIYPVRR